MNHETPYGILQVPTTVTASRLAAVQRALNWCETIVEHSLWNEEMGEDAISLVRTINEQRVEVFPLEAAVMDLGLKNRWPVHHLPIEINGRPACVRASTKRPKPLHTDMVASVLLFLGSTEVLPELVPKTLHALLTNEQLASLPEPVRRQRNMPGQPSTSGRAFLPEERILELTQNHPDEPFRVQFEKRDGTLRNMTARLGVLLDDGDEEGEPSAQLRPLPYDPSTYHLLPVIDTDLMQYRNVAVDRVTMFAVGDISLETASAETHT